MKLAWMFGSSLGAHHLLWSYLAVWLIQGGYAAWIALQWMRSNRDSPDVASASGAHEDS